MNTGAAEVLYSAVGEWAQLDADSTVLDVCCGTGTIGISLAKVASVLWIIVLETANTLKVFFFFMITFCLPASEEGDWN